MGKKGQKLYDDNIIQKYDLNILYADEILYEISSNIIPGIYGYYAVSTYGRIYHKYLKRFLKPGLSGSGYLFVYLSTEFGQKMIQIHRLVMLVFNNIDNSELYDVNHINGCKTDNRLINLEWCTRSQNQKHAYDNGLHKRSNAILNESQVIQICDLLSTQLYTNRQIADIMGYPVSEHMVSDIKKKTSWSYITQKYIFYQRPGKKFSDEFVNNICKYFSENQIGNLSIKDHCRNALDYYNYEKSDDIIDCLRKIYTKKYYTNISKNYLF